jgi:hypothetical protein
MYNDVLDDDALIFAADFNKKSLDPLSGIYGSRNIARGIGALFVLVTLHAFVDDKRNNTGESNWHSQQLRLQ